MNFAPGILFICFLFAALPTALRAAEMNGSGLDCIIEPSSTVKLGSGVPGIIEEIAVDRGDMVKKGQVLVRLDSKVERASMESRKARYDFSKNDYKRKS